VLVLVLATAGTIEEAILARASQKRSLDAKVIQVRVHSAPGGMDSMHGSQMLTS
jgi:SNF2 family DNA or RNA helicase